MSKTNSILRFIVLLIFGLIVIGYTISYIGIDGLAGMIGIGIGIIMIILGIFPRK
ncbi:MAG: hypothetical protein QXE84_06795 [Candidatus Nitrosotenuis sp.]|uniref:Uncharacterized protein n=1 Tax=Candidatus Nitrosotenuis uzonensis TaxID=1407055 RepID=A0A812F236_9ARCH|nr:hypothetical protein [Candidatus Nitrosotenuis uzonensis]CAE6505124.1 hypothetical protein NUZ5A_80002 [Candidatus Nitrosotenuis uzonensis]